MKKILIVTLLGLLFASCAAPKLQLPPYETNHYVLSFDYFSQRGIYVTSSNFVNFEHTPLGYVTGESVGGYEIKNKTVTNDRSDDIYGKDKNPTYKVEYGEYISPKIRDAFQELYNAVKELGGDGVFNLDVTFREKSIIVSGTAIKRK